MKKSLFWHLWILFIVIPAHGAKRAYIYKGTGSCLDGCSEAAADVAAQAGFIPSFIHSALIQARILREASVWIQPGGNAIEVANRLTYDQKEVLKDFVRMGGTYVGFCAGAFLADTFVDDAETIPGLALIPGTTYDYPLPKGSHILPIFWLGKTFHLYFEEGPGFRILSGAEIEIIASYPDGTPATVRFKAGLGNVILSGAHPEAPESWKEGLSDPDGSDIHLAIRLLQASAITSTSR